MSATLHLRVDGLALRAGGRADARELLRGVTFDIRGGERWVVLGPNGAGKSSLLGALAGVLPRAAGSVSLQGRELSRWPLGELAAWRAWCPQFWIDPFPASVRETAQLARERGTVWPWRPDGDDAAVDETLRRLDLTALRDADVRTLSGGERQRVAIATALLQEARLLLLDEPASHLDLAHQQTLVQLLRDHADADHAVVASLHDLNLAWELATHAVLLDGRGAAWVGPRETVLTPAALSAAFGVAVDTVEVCGVQRFWIGPVRSGTA